jgi:NADH:ubiquinone oxidoreductase subunit 6 (subunit J)
MLLSSGIAIVAMGLAVLTCVGKLADTNDYAKATMRGGSAVAEATGAKGAQVGKKGLDMDYAFSWSYGIDETFTLLVPGFKGGSSNELVSDADFGDTRLPLYFGDLQFTSGPVYLGASLVFLFVFGLMLAFVWKKDKPLDSDAQLNYNWAIFGLVTFLVSVILGWGRHFFINEFLFDSLPYYNKFRTPMMALVIAQVVVPMIGILGLYRFIVLVQGDGLSEVAQKKVFKNTLILAGVMVGAVVLLTMSTDFSSPETDKRIAEQGGMETVNKIKDLRSGLVWDDIFRSILFIVALIGLVYLALKKQASTLVAGAVMILLVGFDMIGISKRYLTDDNWEDKETEEAVLPSVIDNQIIANNKDGKRVFDYRGGINGAFNDNRAGAFHRNVGGYHPAKMSRYQDVMSYCIGSSSPTGSGDIMNNHALDMLNCGFIMGISQDGKSEIVVPRTTALGHAWFVDSVDEAATAKEALNMINTLNLRKHAVIEGGDYKAGATAGLALGARNFATDSTAAVTRLFYSNDSIAYESNNNQAGLAVFSEIYYNEKNGAWKAFVDGKEAKALRVNYVLRGLEIPAGKHAVTWVYQPADRSMMVNIEWASSALILLLVGGSLVQLMLKKDELEG